MVQVPGALLPRVRDLARSRAAALIACPRAAVQRESLDDVLPPSLHRVALAGARDALLAFADAPPVTVGFGAVQLTVPAGCEPGRAAVVGVLRLLLDEACDAWTGSLARTVDVCIVGGRPADRRAGWAAVSETAGHIEMLTATITRLVLPAEVLNPARPTTRP